MIQMLVSAAEDVFDFSKVLNASIAVSWMILAVFLFRFLLKGAPRKIHVVLWGLVGLRLLMPFSIESDFSLIPSAKTVPQEMHVMEGSPLQEPAYFDFVANPVFPTHVTVEAGGTVDRVNSYMLLLNAIWIVGMLLLLSYTGVSYFRLKRRVREAVILRKNIYQSEEVASPFVLGIIKPKIYIPYHMGEEDMEHVIAHELAHIHRKDHWWKPLGFLLLTVHCFNPLMWLAYVLLCRDIELACDEKVIKKLDSERRADYLQTLVSCSVNRRSIAACPLAFGEVGVKERVKNVLNYKKPAFWIIGVAVIACTVVAVCFVTNPKSEKWDSDRLVGTYFQNAPEKDPMLFASSLRINEDGSFTYSPSIISSYMGVGTWEIDGDYVILTDSGMGDSRKEVFLFEKGHLYYVEEKSSANSVWQLEDKAEYIPESEVDISMKEPVTDDLPERKEDTFSPSDFRGIETKLFKEMSGEYWMLSGSGGWTTRFYLYGDGYFVGLYEDRDADRISRCEFSGHLQEPSEVNEYTYLSQIEELVYDEPGKVTYEDGYTVTTTTPYGWENTPSLYIFVPGTAISSLSNIEYQWLSAEREEFWDRSFADASDDVLPCFAIRNVLDKGGYLFSKVPEEYQSNLGTKRK